MRSFEDGVLVAFAGPDSSADGLLTGEPGTVIDDNGPGEITVSFLHGPSLSLPADGLTVLSSEEWERRAARIRKGLHPTKSHLID